MLSQKHHETARLRLLVQRLLEAETGEDGMICHDGGFHYNGDFMSMESDIIEPATLLPAGERAALFERGYIVRGVDGDSDAIRVTAAGRAFALGGDAAS